MTDEDQAEIANSQGTGGEGHSLPPTDAEDGNREISSEPPGQSKNDIEKQNNIEPQRSNTSVWASETMSLPQEVLFVATVCLTQFCTQASFCALLLLLNTIGQSLDVEQPALLSWLAAGFSLTAGTFLILAGRLGDAFGYKLMMMIGFSWFALWSLVAGLSVFSGYTLFVFARVFQGIGTAMCMPNALAVLGAAYPAGSRKAMVFALFGASAPVGALTGGIAATALNLLWWPWAFYALAITLSVLTVVTYFVVPSQHGKLSGNITWQNVFTELDLAGGITGVSALILFNFAWNQAPVVGWASAQIIATLIIGLVLFFLFIWIEYRYAKNPLLPFDAFNSDVGFVLAALSCGWSTFGVWALYLILLLENIRDLPPLQAAIWLLPIVVTGLAASLVTGFLLGPAKFRPATVMTMALVSFLAGIVIFTTSPVDQIYWGQTFVSVVIIPFGMDMSFPASTLILSNSVKKEYQGIAASLVATVVNYSISLGVGFAGTVEVHVNNGGKTKADMLKGYRGALYLGIGLAGLGLSICLVFLAKDRMRTAKGARNSIREESRSV